MTRRLVLCWVMGSALAWTACTGGAPGETTPSASPGAVQIGRENIVTVERGVIVTGPIISGELRAARSSVLRAQLGGAVLAIEVDRGAAVRQGAVLARIESRALDEERLSAQSAVRSEENRLTLARREAARTEELVRAGALAARELDIAQSSVASAEAELAGARARLASAETTLRDAVVRAPISGIVSNRAVNAGDIVSPGAELLTIIDPSSMQLEAAAPSESLGALRAGARVEFRVRGYEEPFEGRIERIAPQADAVTRQVPIVVAIPNRGGRLVAGLFAEGRVVDESADGLIVPIDAVNTSGEEPWVLRVAGGRTERVGVTLGLRDPRTERLELASGVSEGDVLLRGPAQGISPGTPVLVGGAG